MKVAVVSDIHGNLPALEAVLAEIDREGVDAIVNAGDTLSGPLLSVETAELLMSRGIPMIAGNHERQVLEQPIERMGESDACTARLIGARHREWLASAPKTRWVGGIGGLAEEVFVCHGTPSSDLEYLLETVVPGFGSDGSPGIRAATHAEIVQRLGAGDHTLRARVIVCGHSHVARVASVASPDGGHAITIVNPGSVGLPGYDDDHVHLHSVEAGSPHARYAILERTPRGWCAQLRCVAYDHEPMARLAEQRNRPDWALPLRTGRMR